MSRLAELIAELCPDGFLQVCYRLGEESRLLLRGCFHRTSQHVAHAPQIVQYSGIVRGEIVRPPVIIISQADITCNLICPGSHDISFG